MSEEKKKDELNISYRFIDHNFKISYVLSRIQDLEREHFALMVDRLDEGHQNYSDWYNAVQEVKGEIERLEFIYKKLGGTFGSEIPGVG